MAPSRLHRLRAVAPHIWVATNHRYLTTTTLVTAPDGTAALIDPVWTADELAEVVADIHALGVRVVIGLSTHADFDHVLWPPALADVVRYASPRTVAEAGRRRESDLAEHGAEWSDDVRATFGRLVAFPGDDRPIPWPARDIVPIVHDAHAPGHTAYWVPSLHALIAGDMLSDVEVPLPDDSGLLAYRAGLDALAPHAAAAWLVVPGHGRPTANGAARVAADRRYLDALATPGAAADDRRLGRAGMAEAHARNLALAAR